MANNYGSHPLKKLDEVTPEMVAKLPAWANYPSIQSQAANCFRVRLADRP